MALWFQKVARQQQARIQELEREIKLERGRMQSFLLAIEASPNGVVVLDQEGAIQWCNQTAACLLRLDPVRDVSQHLVHLVRHPALRAYLQKGDFSQATEFEGLQAQANPYASGVLLLVQDIREQARMAQSRRDFVANLSHEIRTPLTVMLGYVHTLQVLPVEAAQHADYLARIVRNGERLDRLVEDLLALAKLEMPLLVPKAWVDMPALLATLEQEARDYIACTQRELEIVFEVPTSWKVEPGLNGVASELLCAFGNLVTNAIGYTEDGGCITVRWAGQRFSVADTGVGIASEHIPRLTERFYRVDKGRSTQTGGTGLGLAIVKHVALRHDATLLIESQLGVGSVFSLVFRS